MTSSLNCLANVRGSFRARLWSGLSALVAAIAPLIASNATAGQSARLVYSRTAQAVACSDEAGLRHAVARRLGYDPFVAASMNTVVAELRGDGNGLKARVYVIGDGNRAGGTRELTSPTRDCTELMAAVALALSIAIDPDALDRIEQPTPADSSDRPVTDDSADAAPMAQSKPEPGSQATNDVQPGAESPQETEPRTRAVQSDSPIAPSSMPIEGVLGVFGFMATGPAPSPSLGFGITGGVVLNRHWSLTLEPQFALRSSQSMPGTSSMGARVSWMGGALHAGYRLGNLYAGALFEAERVTSTGYGLTEAKTNHSAWLALGLRIAYRQQIWGSWSLVPRAEGALALKRLNLQVAGQEIYQTPSAQVQLGLAVETSF